MVFRDEEGGQIGPFEELYELIVVVTLLFIFTSAVSRSYLEYETQRNPVNRFSAGLDFSWQLRNNVLPLVVNGAPNPGLLSDSVLNEKANYVYLNHFWGKPYEWEVLIRNMSGYVLYEFGSLNKDTEDPRDPKIKIEELMKGSEIEVAVIYSPIAIRHASGTTEFIRMEVWVW